MSDLYDHPPKAVEEFEGDCWREAEQVARAQAYDHFTDLSTPLAHRWIAAKKYELFEQLTSYEMRCDACGAAPCWGHCDWDGHPLDSEGICGDCERKTCKTCADSAPPNSEGDYDACPCTVLPAGGASAR